MLRTKRAGMGEMDNSRKNFVTFVGGIFCLVWLWLTNWHCSAVQSQFGVSSLEGNTLAYVWEFLPTRSENNVTGDQLFDLAFYESYGFFDDITEEDWKMRQTWARSHETRTSHEYFRYHQQSIWYYYNYQPFFSCPHLKRITGNDDGGKWTCDPHRLTKQATRRKQAGGEPPHCLIYSIGSNGNYQFEDGLYDHLGHNNMCEFHIFDYSENYSRSENQKRKMHFHQLGLQGSHENRGSVFVNFKEMIMKLGHENKTIDIFKIDCEGCEWETFHDWIDHDIRQIQIETHKLPPQEAKAVEFFDSFAKHDFVMYSKENNGWGNGDHYEFSYLKLHPEFLHPRKPDQNYTEKQLGYVG